MADEQEQLEETNPPRHPKSNAVIPDPPPLTRDEVQRLARHFELDGLLTFDDNSGS